MIYYTIAGKTDGFGAQYQAIMSGIAFCASKNYTYIHTPFDKIEHDVDVTKLNKFIGIHTDISMNENDSITTQQYAKEVHCHPYPSIYYTPEVINIIRTYYYSTEKPTVGPIDIAIHIRRGDVNITSHQIRYTTNILYKKIIGALKKKYPNYTITIFSEGDINDFRDLGLNIANFKLNTDICETFHSLVSAKILVMAKSSFSYASAILNKNIIYYENFWHKPLNNWLNINSLI